METKQLDERVTVTRLDNSMVEIVVELPTERFAPFRAKAINHFSGHLNLSGFRKGHIPEKTILEHVGEGSVLEEAASLAIREILPYIFKANALDAVGRPEVTVTKLAPGNPFAFTVKTAVVPEITLPDYRSIAQKIRAGQKPVVVEEHEVRDAILQIRKALGAKSGTAEDDTPAELPELTTDLIKKIGDFESVEDFTRRLRAQLEHEKGLRAKEKVRAEIAEALVEATPLPVPDVLIESELQRMRARLDDDLARSGSTLEAYLAQTQKSEEALVADWRPHAQKAATLQLIFNKLAETEGLLPKHEEVDHHATLLMQQLKNADQEAIRIYAATVLQNEAVFQFLETV